jgi:hypothetical protein
MARKYAQGGGSRFSAAQRVEAYRNWEGKSVDAGDGEPVDHSLFVQACGLFVAVKKGGGTQYMFLLILAGLLWNYLPSFFSS